MASKTFFSKSFLSAYRSLRSNWPLLSLHRSSKDHHHHHLKTHLSNLSGKALVVDVEGGLLRSSSTFPYFMLVALEAGSILRGLLLLLLYPLLCCLTQEFAIKVKTKFDLYIYICQCNIYSFRLAMNYKLLSLP